mmetsp:Transcript_28698/g.32820  ORF Transcript_28698/g.32820 Transcript_28698/m.32820 type:complete len:108 (-) Transcript_28698:152-475(-)
MRSLYILSTALLVTFVSSFSTSDNNVNNKSFTRLALHPSQAQELEKCAIEQLQIKMDEKGYKETKPRNPASYLGTFLNNPAGYLGTFLNKKKEKAEQGTKQDPRFAV